MPTPYPREDRSQFEKSLDWKNGLYFKEHLDYAESLLKNLSAARLRMQRSYDGYAGIKSPGSIAYIERTYGKQNKSKFIPYRLARTKLNLLHGEWLKRPLSATVETINSESKNEKRAQVDFLLGAMTGRDTIEKIKQVSGIDIMNGVQIPQSEDDPIWEKMSAKDKDETIMQIILDEQTKTLDLKKKIAECFLDILICSLCFCEIETDEDGDVHFNHISPMNAIFEEIEGDDYIEKSPIKGARKQLPVHEILVRYPLTKAQRDILDMARRDHSTWVGIGGKSRGYMRMTGGELLCDVIHIEWDSVEPEYFLLSPKSKSQMEFDGDDPLANSYYRMDMDGAEWEKNGTYKGRKLSGDEKVETKYKVVRYEATRIGGMIDVNMRKKMFTARNWDDPTKILNSTYWGYVCGTVDGVRLSLYQIAENFDNLFDIIQYHKNMALARAKGKALFYDRAGLPEGKTTRQVMHEILNDGFIDWNSAAGNYAQRGLSALDAIKEVDLGLSASFEYFLKAEENVLSNISQITGINENRQGDITASSTVTNANTAIQNSRTITEPIFFGMNGFVSRVMQSIVDTSAISWAYYKTEKGEQILGTDKFRYLQVTKRTGQKNYGVHVQDGGKYMEMKQVMNNAMNISLNAKELRPIDYFKVNMAETMADAKNILMSSWDDLQKNVAKMQAEDNRVKQEISQAQQQNLKQMATENREDVQRSQKEDIVLKGDTTIKVNREKSKDKLIEQSHKQEGEILLGGE